MSPKEPRLPAMSGWCDLVAHLRSVTFGRLVSLERQSLIKVGRKLTLTLADRTLLIRAALETASDLSLDWLSQFETKRCH